MSNIVLGATWGLGRKGKKKENKREGKEKKGKKEREEKGEVSVHGR